MFPNDFTPHESVSYHYYKWIKDGVFERVNIELNKLYRAEVGREETPSALIVDSQTAAASSAGGPAEYDGNKKKKSRKRNVRVDTLGLAGFVFINEANIHDLQGAKAMFMAANGKENFKRVALVFADAGYRGEAVEAAAAENGRKIVIATGEKGKFVVIRKRRGGERTFGGFHTSRSLSRDYERTLAGSETMIYIRMIRLNVRKLCKERELKSAA